MYIIGSGLAGCIAAILNPNAIILEASENKKINHKAVLRFRTNEISKLTGIKFDEVKVRKCIFYKDNIYDKCSIPHGNLYSKKVVDNISDRSIWNLDHETRFIAPNDFHSILLDRLKDRIYYNNKVFTIDENSISTNSDIYDRKNKPIINTMPINFMPKIVGFGNELIKQKFNYKNIKTVNLKIDESNVYQTFYYPDFNFPIYRATLSGQNFICEFVNDFDESESNIHINKVLSDIGLSYNSFILDQIEINNQKFGKISSIDDKIRKNFISELTDRLDIYSLGRFAIWKNILLDDVLDDLYVIQRLIQSDSYSRKIGEKIK